MDMWDQSVLACANMAVLCANCDIEYARQLCAIYERTHNVIACLAMDHDAFRAPPGPGMKIARKKVYV